MTQLVRVINVAATLRQMEVGETLAICFDVIKPSSLRVAASKLGTEMGRRYTVAQNRITKMAEVTRHE